MIHKKEENRLIVRNFGPLTATDTVLRKVTVFVGAQGVGKSTLAKLYSLFFWMEKRLIRGMLTTARLEKGNMFRNSYCGYHRLSHYFKDNTFIKFIGTNYTFTFADGKFAVEEVEREFTGEVMKVMYVPAERNFLSSLGNIIGLKTLPASLHTFKEEYEGACNALANGYELPIYHTSFEYDRLNHIAWLKGKDFRIRLADASSGFQALLPLVLVSQYLTDLVARLQSHHDNGLNIEELDKLREEVKRLMANDAISSEVREAALTSLSARFAYSGFVNVVEEPEENLYPESQKHILWKLLALCNSAAGNRLVLTTHSPYIINYLTLAIKAKEILAMGGDSAQVDSIVPIRSALSTNEVAIYELSGGNAHLLSMQSGVPSDANLLNLALADTNSIFGELLDIEEEIQNDN